MPAFSWNIKLEQLQITVINNQMTLVKISVLKGNLHYYSPNIFLELFRKVLWLAIRANFIFIENETEAIAGHNFEVIM